MELTSFLQGTVLAVAVATEFILSQVEPALNAT
jgi:hypothetical protein